MSCKNYINFHVSAIVATSIGLVLTGDTIAKKHKRLVNSCRDSLENTTGLYLEQTLHRYIIHRLVASGKDHNHRCNACRQCGRGKFCSVAAGKHHSVALTHVGEIWTWGHGSFGQLGHAAEALSAEERPEHVSIGLCKPTLVAPLSPILLPMQDRYIFLSEI